MEETVVYLAEDTELALGREFATLYYFFKRGIQIKIFVHGVSFADFFYKLRKPRDL